jgi:hypothetical protein
MPFCPVCVLAFCLKKGRLENENEKKTKERRV